MIFHPFSSRVSQALLPDACTGISPVETNLKVFYKNWTLSDKLEKMQSLNFHREIILNVNVYLFCLCLCLCCVFVWQTERETETKTTRDTWELSCQTSKHTSKRGDNLKWTLIFQLCSYKLFVLFCSTISMYNLFTEKTLKLINAWFLTHILSMCLIALFYSIDSQLFQGKEQEMSVKYIAAILTHIWFFLLTVYLCFKVIVLCSRPFAQTLCTLHPWEKQVTVCIQLI